MSFFGESLKYFDRLKYLWEHFSSQKWLWMSVIVMVMQKELVTSGQELFIGHCAVTKIKIRTQSSELAGLLLQEVLSHSCWMSLAFLALLLCISCKAFKTTEVLFWNKTWFKKKEKEKGSFLSIKSCRKKIWVKADIRAFRSDFASQRGEGKFY